MRLFIRRKPTSVLPWHRLANAVLLQVGLLLAICVATSARAHAADADKHAVTDERRLFIEDGQMRSHIVSVFVTVDIWAEQAPRLYFLAPHAVTDVQEGETEPQVPLAIARKQTRVVEVGGIKQTRNGTLLIFDLSKYPFPWYKAMLRLSPLLTWNRKVSQDEDAACLVSDTRKSCEMIAGEKPINLGQPVVAYCMTTLILLGVLGCIVFWARGRKSGARGLISSDGGKVSLSLTQMAAWTIAVAWVFLSFGLVKRTVPELPWQTVALMGLSLMTAGLVGYKDPKIVANNEKVAHSSGFKALLEDTATGNLSLARAQMVVWTTVTLLLFITKSMLEGEVWAVPGELVLLMGMSQAGYMAPKWRAAAEAKAAPVEATSGEVPADSAASDSQTG